MKSRREILKESKKKRTFQKEIKEFTRSTPDFSNWIYYRMNKKKNKNVGTKAHRNENYTFVQL